VGRTFLAFFAGESEEGERRLAEALEHPDPWVRAATMLIRAQGAENRGDQEHMRADIQRATAAFRELGDTWGLAMALTSQAGAAMVAGDLDAAEEALDEATELVERVEGSTGTGMLAVHVADVRLRRGDLAGAREAALQALGRSDMGTDGSAFALASLARIAAVEGDGEALRGYVEAAEERMQRAGPRRPEQGHGRAFVDVMQARLALSTGDLEAVDGWLAHGYEAALATQDMPVVAIVGVAAAAAAAAAGRQEEAAELLGAATEVRGAEDATNPEVAWVAAEARAALGEDRFAAAYARGRSLDRDAALDRMRPVGSGAAPVGP
jgi:tetratricopeptide (TPR) repeat protein